MKSGAPGAFATRLKALREAAGFTQEELATIAGLSVHAVSALERGERRRPHVETVRALSAALDLTGPARDALLGSARTPARDAAVDELSRTTLPVPMTPLLGRDGDVQTLRRWLSDRSIRLITLLGPGGVGKTRLVLEVARTITEDGSARVVFVELAAVQDAAFVASAIAEAFGLSDVTAIDLPRRIQTASADPTILVLDNCEHILDAVPLISDLLASVTSLRVLATSRASLRVRGEREFAVEPLALAPDEDALSPADLVRSPAVRLFVERVRDVRPDFRLTAANGQTVRAICRRLDALPLALEIAAPWLKVLTPENLLQRLERDLLLSAVGPRDLPERQRTMNAAVAWSYQLLNDDEQRAFRRLGAVPGRFTIESAAHVLSGGNGAAASFDRALEVVARLIDKSLVLRAESAAGSRPFYQMLETVRAFAIGQLTAVGERDETLQGLARYCVEEARLAAEGLVGPEQARWLDRVRSDLENHRAAMTWLIACGRSAEASEIVWGLVMFWLIRGHAAEGLHWYEQVLRVPSPMPLVESRMLIGSSLMLYAQGDLPRAQSILPRALAFAEALDDPVLAGHARTMAGHVEHATGHIAEARNQFVQAAAQFRARSFDWAVGSALSGQAGVALASGDVAAAERLFAEAISALRGSGPWFLAPVRCFRAVLAVQRGQVDEAIVLMRDSLTDIRDLRDKYAFVYALVPLAAAAVLKSDFAWTARLLGARAAVIERTGSRVVVRVVYELLERAEQQARAHLTEEQWTSAYAAGRAASIDTILKDIDAHLVR